MEASVRGRGVGRAPTSTLLLLLLLLLLFLALYDAVVPQRLPDADGDAVQLRGHAVGHLLPDAAEGGAEVVAEVVHGADAGAGIHGGSCCNNRGGGVAVGDIKEGRELDQVLPLLAAEEGENWKKDTRRGQQERGVDRVRGGGGRGNDGEAAMERSKGRNRNRGKGET